MPLHHENRALDPVVGGEASASWTALPAQPMPSTERDLLRLSAHLLRDQFGAGVASELAPQSVQSLIHTFDMILAQEPLSCTLSHVASQVEQENPGVYCTLIYLVNGAFQAAGNLEFLHETEEHSNDLAQALLDFSLESKNFEDHALCIQLSSLMAICGGCICNAAVIPSSVVNAWGVGLLWRTAGQGGSSLPVAGQLASQIAGVVLDHHYLYELLIRQANYDMLTGLPNRIHFDERLDAALAESKRDGTRAVVLWIDLDRFQEINDTLGHRSGDEVLRLVAHRLSQVLPGSALLARMGGDEFAVLLPHWGDWTKVEPLSEQLLHAIRQPYQVGRNEIFLTASIGYAAFPEHGEDSGALQRSADGALHQVKRSGRNHCRVFSASLSLALQDRLELETQLQQALDRKEFRMHYQPQVKPNGELEGFEALLRWYHPQRGLMSPAHFIPIAEELGTIVPIGRWVLHEACRQLAEWRTAGLPSVRIAVNVSAIQLFWAQFVDSVRESLETFDVDPKQIELELTESAVLPNIEQAVEQMHRLRALGVQLSIDDFGIGYSSLSYLQRLPVHALKIDRSFICDLQKNKNAPAVVQAIVVLGHNLGLSVVAEGVELPQQWQQLREFGCDLLQGYLIGRPAAVDAATALLRLHKQQQLLVPA